MVFVSTECECKQFAKKFGKNMKTFRVAEDILVKYIGKIERLGGDVSKSDSEYIITCYNHVDFIKILRLIQGIRKTRFNPVTGKKK